MNDVIALIRRPNGYSARVPTFPGQYVAIVGGLGEVRHEMHMPAVLQMGPDTRVEMDPGWADFLPKWVKMIGGEEHITCTLVVPEKAPTTGWPDGQDFASVVFGSHPAGHQCRFCEGKRKKARLAAAA